MVEGVKESRGDVPTGVRLVRVGSWRGALSSPVAPLKRSLSKAGGVDGAPSSEAGWDMVSEGGGGEGRAGQSARPEGTVLYMCHAPSTPEAIKHARMSSSNVQASRLQLVLDAGH